MPRSPRADHDHIRRLDDFLDVLYGELILDFRDDTGGRIMGAQHFAQNFHVVRLAAEAERDESTCTSAPTAMSAILFGQRGQITL